jgi:hypothetical protein
MEPLDHDDDFTIFYINVHIYITMKYVYVWNIKENLCFQRKKKT